MTIEEYLNKPYWVIDILPKQVPAGSKGQYFRIEKYFLEHPQIDNIYRTVYNPTEEVLELIGSLAGSEGLFMWKPKN